jgi:hypothetical protein
MKTKNQNKRSNGAPPAQKTGWLLSEEALIRVLLKTSRQTIGSQKLHPQTANRKRRGPQASGAPR